MRTTVITLLISAFLTGTVWADRSLGDAEISQVFQILTSQPRKTWISSGTISAAHEEYRAPKTTDAGEIDDRIAVEIQAYQAKTDKTPVAAHIRKMKLDAIPFNVRYKLSNEYTMNSTVVVKYDGTRFNWEINVNSRTDSLKPSTDLAGNSMTRQFRQDWNGRRVFAWDGQKYTLYSRSANNAIVDASGSTPRAVNGPLTAGLIRWGYGSYTFESLSASQSSGVETVVGGQTQIHLTLDKSDGSQMRFVLDADRDYAVVSHSTHRSDRAVYNQYGSFQTVSGSLVPTVIVIEQYDAGTNRLLASDFWSFTSISGNAPGAGDFSVDYQDGALIEYISSVAASSVTYRHSQRLNTELLLAERLTFSASEKEGGQNCATAALRYAALRLGRNVSDRQLGQLVRTDGKTSLYAMKEFARGQGLHCRAVKTDIRTLQNLTDCQVILHLPDKNHFVLLGDIDNANVWCIDLASKRFCYRADVSFFGMDWTEGTALLISNAPIAGSFNDIDDSGLQNITGGTGYSCTNLLQEDDVTYCDSMGLYGCGSAYEYEPERWGCEEAPSGMCMDSPMLSLAQCDCAADSEGRNCGVDGDWEFYYILACY